MNGGYALELTRPIFLIALALLLPVGYYFARSLVDFSRRQRLASVIVRSLIIILLALALAGLTLMKPTKQQFVVFAVDRSLSVGDEQNKIADAFVADAMEHAGSNRAALVEFAAEPKQVRDAANAADQPNPAADPGADPAAAEAEAAHRRATDLSAVLELAAAAVPPMYVPHIVLISDGNETAGDVMKTAGNLGVRISSVPLKTRSDPEVQVTSITGPSAVREGEPFYLDVTVDANIEGEGFIELFRGAHRVDRRPLKVMKGETKLRIHDAIRKQRLADYSVRITGFNDTLLDNNLAEALVFTAGKPRVLMIESDPRQARHLVSSLKQEDVEIEVRPPEGMPQSLSDLQNYELLILSNVPATSLSLRQMEVARTYVQDLGGGLIMIGGERSFGLGGYYKTVIEEVLPVRSDFEKEKQKPSLAMVLVIDKSGSMGGIKIELAKDAARAAVELLGPSDQIGIIVFDGQFYWVSEIHPASDRAHLIDRIASITAGGGTTMAPAMEEAYQALLTATAKLKHVIVLTDGISSPGDFEGIASNMAAARMTVSTVAIGDGAAGELLEQIAQIGNGRYYVAGDPASVPQIFAKETVTASKSAILEQPFLPYVLRPTPALAGIDFESAPFLLGYVRTRPKPTSELILLTESGDPLLAWWRYGLGMTVAFTSDAKSRWGAEWVMWPGYSRFWAQVIRHAMRRSAGEGVVMEVNHRGGEAHVTVDSVGADSRYLNGVPTKLVVIAPDLSRQAVTMEQSAPGRYRARFETPQSGAYHIELDQGAPGKTPGNGEHHRQSRGLVVGYPPELRLQETNESLLRTLAQTTGGVYEPTPAAVFAEPERTARQAIPLWPYLVAAAVMLWVIDVLLRRVDLTRRDALVPSMASQGKRAMPLALQGHAVSRGIEPIPLQSQRHATPDSDPDY